MRPVVVQFWVSLDGYSCDPGTELGRYLEDVEDPEQEEYFVSRLREVGTHIVGRSTYQGMSKFFPGKTHPLADAMNEIPKVVFSSTLEHADWPPTRIARGDLATEIARLKNEPGGIILAHGGTRFVRELIRLGLADEFRLWVVPAAVGTGTPLFTALEHPLPLRLLSARSFPSGLLELAYAPAGR